MKQVFVPMLCLAICLITHVVEARKTALLVGISEYQEPPFSSQTLQAKRGLQLMQSTLMGQGFSSEDIVTLTGMYASRKGIEEAFEQYLFSAKHGDIVVFYFYGHGVQIEDTNRDEVDKLDEAIVPFDGIRRSNSDHQNLIHDDLLGQWIRRVRKQIGVDGQVIVLVDACHSGGGLRGRHRKIKPDRYKLSNTYSDSGGLAPFIAFYSSMPHQSSHELNLGNEGKMALLTWAFCKSMQDINQNSTFRGLFEQTTLYMASASLKQTPQMEGNPDRIVFGGQVEAPPPYFKPIAVLDNQELLIAGGLMHGLQAGSRMTLYPPETRDTSTVKPFAIGTVRNTGLGLLESIVWLDKPIPEKLLGSSWLFVRERRFMGFSLHLNLRMKSPKLKIMLLERIADMEVIQISERDSSNLILIEERGSLQLLTMDNLKIWERKVPGNTDDEIIRSLELALGNYLQAHFLRNLEFKDSPYQATFTVQVGSFSAHESSIGSLRMNKDTAILKILNQGVKPVYYTILDIDARNTVHILLPREMDLPADYRLEPGEESPPHKVRFNSSGKEVLKLILTQQPIDLGPVVASRGGNQDGLSFFESLFSQSYWNGNQSRGPSGIYTGNEAGVETIVLDVVK
jgi:hypothetical protein